MANSIRENLTSVLERIHAAADRAGRDPSAVRLVAVSKTMPPERILEAHAAGQRRFGENRVQELAAKAPALPGEIEWHFIGRLQKNKVRPAVRLAAWIHSADSAPLLQRIDRIAGEENRRPFVLLEINVSGEASKAGVPPAQAPELAAAAARCANLRLAGLMTIGPLGAGAQSLHRAFSRLRELRDELEKDLRIELPELSMGMSGDFEIAVEEGATLVRVGSAIFGPRSCALPPDGAASHSGK